MLVRKELSAVVVKAEERCNHESLFITLYSGF